MSVTVGTLRIDLMAETASFTQSMDKASQLSAKTANDIKRSLEKIGAMGIAMGAAIATGTAALIKGAIDSADQLGKLAQSAGTTAETLSVLNYAAKLSGVQTDQLGVGLVRLSKAAFAAQGGNVQLERIFGRLGVTATDSNGKLKDSGVLMEQLAVKFSSVADGSGKTAIATALFGKSGAALIPFLDRYGASQARVNAEAHRFGLALSTSTIEVAAEAKENIGKLEEQFRGLGFTILSASLPAIEKLSEKLLKVSGDANLPSLAKDFGDKLTSTANVVGNALDFAAQHAHALKIALEGLAGLQLAKIAIPVIGDLSAGGIENVGKGIDRATVGLLGMQKTLTALKELSVWAKACAKSTVLLAQGEGVASAATYVLTGAMTALEAPLILTGIGALGFAFYKIASGIKQSSQEGIRFRDVLHGLTAMNLLKLAEGDSSGLALSIAESAQKHSIPQRFLSKMPESDPAFSSHPKNILDTSGLGKAQKSPYDDEIRKLDQAMAAQKAYLAVIDGTPEKIEEVNAAEKARSMIIELNNRLIDAGRPKLTALQEATINLKVAQAASTEALVAYGRELVSQQHSTDLATQQARAMAAANLEGDAAIRRVAVANAILALSYNKTAMELRTMAPELAKLRKELTEKSNIDIVSGSNKAIFDLQQQLAARKILTTATLDSLDAQRQADLASKTYAIDQQIPTTASGAAKDALMQQRQAIVDLTNAQWNATDAQAALSLLSPVDQYNRETDSLNHAVNALRQLQGGTSSYGEQLQIAAKMQENFNAATDKTIQLLLNEGSASDGVKAFFLKMQEQAQTTGSIIYDSLNNAFNGISDNFAKLLSGGKADFAKTFQGISEQMWNSVIKKGMQDSLGPLGKTMGINLGTLSKPDGSSSGKALWVRMASDSGSELSSFGQGSSGIAGMLGLGKGPAGSSSGSGSSNVFSSISAKIASLFGMGKKSSGGSSLMPDTTAIGLDDLIPETPLQSAMPDMFANMGSDLSAGSEQTYTPPDNKQIVGGDVTQIVGGVLDLLMKRADGGPVSPSSAYLVGERGPEILAGASGRIFSNADSRRMLSGSSGDTHNCYIDARGSNDPAQVTAHIDRYMRKAGPQIAAAAVHAMKDQTMRRPASAR